MANTLRETVGPSDASTTSRAIGKEDQPILDYLRQFVAARGAATLVTFSENVDAEISTRVETEMSPTIADDVFNRLGQLLARRTFRCKLLRQIRGFRSRIVGRG